MNIPRDMEIVDLGECFIWSISGLLVDFCTKLQLVKVGLPHELCDPRDNNATFGITKLAEVEFLKKFIVQIYREVYTLVKRATRRVVEKTCCQLP